MKEAFYLMKRLITVSISMVIILFINLFELPVSAQDAEMYEVGSANLNVRSSPNHQAPIIGKLDKGDRVKVYKESFGWVQTYYGGQEAWVASQYLFKPSSSAKAAGYTQKNLPKAQNAATLTSKDKVFAAGTSNLNVRSGPSHDAPIIGQLQNGDKVRVYKEFFGWVQTYYDGQEAWVASQYLFEVNETNQTQVSKKTSKKNTENTQAEKVESTKKDEQKKREANTASTGSLQGYNIVIDPGHGGKDPGSLGVNGVFEKDIIMRTADHVEQKLRQAGATVILTRNSDYYISLNERVRLSNLYHTHAFISLHYNAHPLMRMNGIETYYHLGEKNRDLASNIQGSLEQNVSLQGRGIKESNFYVLRKNRFPSVLVELGFITNPGDLSMAQSEDYQNTVANSIVEGLMNYFN